MAQIQTALILYPHQLFAPELLPDADIIYVVEEPLFFGTDKQYPLPIHKQKLVLHRASMRRYVEEVLWPSDLNVEYIELKDVEFTVDVLVRAQKAGAEQVFVFDPADVRLEERLKQALDDVVEAPFELRILPTPGFMLKQTEVRDYLTEKPAHTFADFYQWQRERFNILIDKKYKPVGGKWSYETQEHKPLPADQGTPGFNGFGDSQYVAEAIKWVDKHFIGNPGKLENFFWPTSHGEAEAWLQEFFKERLEDFAQYGDTVESSELFLYHSGISAPLNIGLLTPQQVVQAALAYHAKKPVNLPSLESFLRYVIGYREYVRGAYVTGRASEHTTSPRQSRNLSSQWWDGTTGIPPLDDAIHKVVKSGYAHQAERRMIIGNLMLLCEIEPTEIYRWFATMCIDAYDWSLVPTVYGMTQLSDQRDMDDKPSIAASSYILGTSHYKKDIWCDVWDGLYWGYIERYKDVLLQNPRTSIAVKGLHKLSADHKRIIGYRADDFLASIT